MYQFVTFPLLISLTLLPFAEFEVEDLVPQFFRVASGGGIVTPLVDDLYTSCTLSMGTLESNSSSTSAKHASWREYAW